MMTKRNWMVVLLVLTAAALTCGLEAEQSSSGLVGPAATCDFYAAGTGTATAAGSKAQPWDLQTALNQPAALLPGMTLCLRGGTYAGIFTSTIKGTAGNLITVRSAPGEWAVLDGYVRSTLAADIAANTKTISVVDASAFPKMVVGDVSIGADLFQINGWTGNSLTVYQGLSTGHPQGAPIIARGAALKVRGSYVVFRDFEILNSSPLRADPDFYTRTSGLYMYAPHSDVVNLVIHDTLTGLGFWESAVDSVAVGNLIYNNGQVKNGIGIYTQNETGEKRIADNITFGNFNLGMQMYSTFVGMQTGYTYDGNVNINNRYLFGGQQPMDALTVTNSFLYGSMLEFGYGSSGPHGSVTITGNYVYAPGPFELKNWNAATVTNNKFYQMVSQQGAVMYVALPVNGSLANYTFAYNDYLFGRSWQDAPFSLKLGTASATGHQFAAWQALSGDTTSAYRGATQTNKAVPQPTGLDVFYRANPYEAGRGNIIIYNYDGAAEVLIDPSKVGLAIGQSYQIRNGQNFLAAPLAVGIYSGKFLSVPLGGLTVAQPVTNNGELNIETPKFAVLVIVPGELPPPTLAVSVTEARYYTVSGNPPDNSGGWSVQFKYDGADFGAVDASSPYTCTALLPMASYTFTGIWTKLGQPTVITQPFVVQVK